MYTCRGSSLLKPNGKHKMINEMNDDGIQRLQEKQVTPWADLRNNAAHGNMTAYISDKVTDFLRGVSDFCANCS